MFGRHNSGIETEERTTDRTGTVPSQRESVETTTGEEAQRDRYAGTNWGAAFFGWLVAIALTVLLAGITGAVAAAVGYGNDLTSDQLADNAGTTGIAAGIAVVVILTIAYFAGGYVAGRMSRFDGGKQGVAVWLIGLLVTVVAAGIGVAFGAQYDVLDRVDLPSLSVPTEQVGLGGAITAATVLVLTLLAAMAGGKTGRRYHRKVDRLA